jgi:hypothetical protein
VDAWQVIESFKDETVYVSPMEEDRPVREWQRCTADNGYCHGVSEALAEYLEEHGIHAWLSDEPWASPNEEWAEFGANSPEELGYDDRELTGAPFHTTTFALIDNFLYSIDYTASQYGYDQFPLIQRWDDAAGWQRKVEARNG